jgi:hypothetical protein
MIVDEIVDASRSGGTNTSHTIIIDSLIRLLSVVPRNAAADEYARAILEENVLGKATVGSRQRTLRYLRELYSLRPDSFLFRALRDLWTDDPKGQPLIGGLCALARDSVFNASAPAILESHPGDEIESGDLAKAVEKKFPNSYSEVTLAKIGRNTFSSWEQSGHLEIVSRTKKVRRRPTCTTAATSYALFLGYLQGVRGEALFETSWAKVLDQPRSQLIDFANAGSQKRFIDFRYSGGVIDVGFTELLRPFEGQFL